MTELLINDRAVLVDVLVAHQRLDIEGCLCGWNELGRSHAEHVAAAYEAALAEDQPVLDAGPRRVFEWAAQQLALADDAQATSQRHAAAGTDHFNMSQYTRLGERAAAIREAVGALTGWPT